MTDDTYYVVYNAHSDTFSLSEAAVIRYHELKGLTVYTVYKAVDECNRLIVAYFYDPPNGRSLNEMYRSSVPMFEPGNIPRHDPHLVQVVRELGPKASGRYSDLRIHQLNGNMYQIISAYGAEEVVEPEDQVWIIID